MYSAWFIYLDSESTASQLGAEGSYIVCNGVLAGKHMHLIRRITGLKELRNIKTVLRRTAYIVAVLPDRTRSSMKSYKHVHALNEFTKGIRKNFIV